MARSHALSRPLCHMEYVSGPRGAAARPRTAVWICEYPYHTMRLEGPSAECGDCPVWQELQRNRRVLDAGADEPQEELEDLPLSVV